MDTSIRTRKRLRLAKKARALYLRGYTTEELSHIYGVTTVSVKRWYILTGGISQRDTAQHKYNRLIMKLPEKDKNKQAGTPRLASL